MMPTQLPVLESPPVLLRELTGADAGLVQSLAPAPRRPSQRGWLTIAQDPV